MVKTKIFTLVAAEIEGKEEFYLSYSGNMLINEAMNFCQQILLNEEKQKAIEEYKKGLQDADSL